MGLLIIGASEDRPKLATCLDCDTPFYVGEERAYEQHVLLCSARHEDEMRAASLREREPGIFGEGPEPDLERWVKVNAKKIIEGRLKM